MVLVKSETMSEKQLGRIAMKALKLEAQGYPIMTIMHCAEQEGKVYGSYDENGDFIITIL